MRAPASSCRARRRGGCARPRRAHACDDTDTGAHARRFDGGAIDSADSIVTTFRLFSSSSKLYSLRTLALTIDATRVVAHRELVSGVSLRPVLLRF